MIHVYMYIDRNYLRYRRLSFISAHISSRQLSHFRSGTARGEEGEEGLSAGHHVVIDIRIGMQSI